MTEGLGSCGGSDYGESVGDYACCDWNTDDCCGTGYYTETG